MLFGEQRYFGFALVAVMRPDTRYLRFVSQWFALSNSLAIWLASILITVVNEMLRRSIIS
ncbi:MAG: hypothetical protein DMF08_03360 [Verrucomicrobia bacterium]|nr:MAG: hypothetical protein DMF08_03360 [Verrucomicrobiota bacterium]